MMQQFAAIVFIGLMAALRAAHATDAERLASEARALFPAVLAEETPT